jgi:small-conductance mechanosensitive channel
MDSFVQILRLWSPALTLLTVVAFAAWVTRLALLRRVRRWAEKTQSRFDDLLIESLDRIWIRGLVLAAVVPGLRFAPLSEEKRQLFERASIALLLLIVTWEASNLLGRWFEQEGPEAATRPSLLRKLVRGTILVAGILLILDNLGVEISALLTALGLGSLAIALGLQPTLANFFAGLHLTMSKPIRVGDFIQLEDGSQGQVVDISWRATRIRLAASNDLIVPNSKLAEMRILNFDQPAPELSVVVPLSVAYGSDLDRVETVLTEVARSVEAEVAGGVRDFEPLVRFRRFGSDAIELAVILRAQTFSDQPVLTSEFLKRVHRRFALEGIEIPFPQRVVHFASGTSGPGARPSEEEPARG